MNWKPAAEVPEAPLFVVRSVRNDDADDVAVDQFEGCWVVRPGAPMNREMWDRWAARHQVTHWFPLPDLPS